MERSWKFTALSVTGERHDRDGAPCSDASAALRDEEGSLLILVAADGAGSEARSAAGARGAVDVVARSLPARARATPGLLEAPELLGPLLIDVARDVRDRLAEASASAGSTSTAGDEPGGGRADLPTLQDYATTLLVALVTERHLATLQIGDGYIVRLHSAGGAEALFAPSRGRFVNETCFVTSLSSFDELVASGEVRTRVAPLDGMTGVALLTDGLEHVAMDMREGGSPHPPFFDGLVRALLDHPPGAFRDMLHRYLVESPRVRERTDDDKSLVLAIDARTVAAARSSGERAAGGIGGEREPGAAASRSDGGGARS